VPPLKVYIDVMRAKFTPSPWPPVVAAALMACPSGAFAQAFAADYGLAPPAGWAGQHGFSAQGPRGLLVAPAVQSDPHFVGAGLSVAAGRNWFAKVAVGRSLAIGSAPAGMPSRDGLSVAGGYRWSDGQALSLQVTGARGGNRLGLSVSYDWPRYFVRLSRDSGLNPAPQENVRFSAGMRF